MRAKLEPQGLTAEGQTRAVLELRETFRRTYVGAFAQEKRRLGPEGALTAWMTAGRRGSVQCRLGGRDLSGTLALGKAMGVGVGGAPHRGR